MTSFCQPAGIFLCYVFRCIGSSLLYFQITSSWLYAKRFAQVKELCVDDNESVRYRLSALLAVVLYCLRLTLWSEKSRIVYIQQGREVLRLLGKAAQFVKSLLFA